mmetsp:Transcript_1622/g.4874  ORF Transcript_1622/g.4874 Transcript_1622/m.4874 type:complete len:108 (-) Transcript_1622:1897-2220(-)
MGDEKKELSKHSRKEMLKDVGLIVKQESAKHNVVFEPRTVMCLAEILEAYAKDRVGPDLEAFAGHVKKSTIGTEEVLLLARRNEDLKAELRSKHELRKSKAGSSKQR